MSGVTLNSGDRSRLTSVFDRYPEFKQKIADPLKNGRAKLAMARLAVVLKAVMLRRTKTMMIEGKPLLTLPKREIIAVKGPFVDPSVLHHARTPQIHR